MRNYNLWHQSKLFGEKIIYFLLLYIAFTLLATAESLPDPTRPFDVKTQSVERVEPVLQSVLISSSHQVAIIDGKRVKLGDEYEGARLVSVDVDEAILKGVQGQQILRLFPEAKKNQSKWEKKPSNNVMIPGAPVIHRQ